MAITAFFPPKWFRKHLPGNRVLGLHLGPWARLGMPRVTARPSCLVTANPGKRGAGPPPPQLSLGHHSSPHLMWAMLPVLGERACPTLSVSPAWGLLSPCPHTAGRKLTWRSSDLAPQRSSARPPEECLGTGGQEDLRSSRGVGGVVKAFSFFCCFYFLSF